MLAGERVDIENESDVVDVVGQELLEAVNLGGVEGVVAREERLLQLLQFGSFRERLIILRNLHVLSLHGIVRRLRVHEEYGAGAEETQNGKNGAHHIIVLCALPADTPALMRRAFFVKTHKSQGVGII